MNATNPMNKPMLKYLKHAIYVALAALLAAIFLMNNPAQAYDNIIKPYQSPRSSAMGGVKLTTGLYDENFFGNPARVTANPKWKVQMPDPMLESTVSTLGNINKIIKADDNFLQSVGSTSGSNLHVRIQMTFPSVYLPGENDHWAFGLITSVQTDSGLRNSFQVNPSVVTDIGPAITYGRKLMDEGRLSVGATMHAIYRVSSDGSTSMLDVIQGRSLSPLDTGGTGSMIDFDLGMTYRVNWRPMEFDINTAMAFNNLLGGKYSNLGIKLKDTGRLPIEQPRTFGFGISASKPSLWKFTDFVLALEFQDIGNNTNGNLFRVVHIGSEATYGVLKPRLGFNQGYIAAGLGLALKFMDLDLCTYGEELSLVTGRQQDRRLALRLAFQI
ncbi:MAG: hypothetical protein AB7P04_07695 [Bacteriovoracia bacterium]